ncbi:MAG: DUF4258 domain-containing protein [Nitrospirae bacterium]|nr:DUF4258 domain-containing protein [Nitrospirota bacterium]
MDIADDDIHQHILARMQQRGVTMEEIQMVLNEGQDAKDCKPGTRGKVMKFQYQKEWEGNNYEEKEVTVYYKIKEEKVVLLTVKARYGSQF